MGLYRGTLRVFLLAFVLLLTVAGPASAATIVVNQTMDNSPGSDAGCNLREAIINGSMNPGVIGCPQGSTTATDVIIVPPGYYVLRQFGGEEDAGMTGDFDIGEAIELRGAGRNETIIDGGSVQDRVFHVLGGVTATIRSLTVTDGGEAEAGGGIRNDGAALTLRDVLVIGNSTAGDGGGVFSAGALTISDSAIVDNTAFNGGGVYGNDITIERSLIGGNDANQGGGIHAPADLTVSQTRILGNGAGENGGGVFTVDGPLSISDVTVNDNHAAGGGGGFWLDSSFPDEVVQRAVLRGNSAQGGGGGIFFAGSVGVTNSAILNNMSFGDGGGLQIPSFAGEVSISRSRISGNQAALDGGGALTAAVGVSFDDVTVSDNAAGVFSNTSGQGGGIHMGGAVTFTNVTISGNTSDPAEEGGGIYNNGGIATLVNSTFAGNHAFSGENIHNALGAQANATNTLFVGDSDRDQCSGGAIAGSNNLAFDPTEGDDCGSTQTDDIFLGPLKNNGGPTPTHAIVPGDDAENGGLNCPPTDQRGVPRPQGAGCDVGAYELARCLGGIVNRVGTPGNDQMSGNSSAEVFLTLGGKDTVTPGGGNDRLCLGSGSDTAKIRGGGKDKAAGEGGRDRVRRDSTDVVTGFEVFF